MKYIPNKVRAFSLIETIIAMVILSASLAAAVRVMGTSLFRIQENQNRIVAVYLAQECMELTRNVRDSAWRQNMPWHCPFLDEADITLNAPVKYLTIENSTVNTQNVTPNSLSDYSFCRGNFGVKVTQDTNQEGLEIENRGVIYRQNLVIDNLGIKEDIQTLQGVPTPVNVVQEMQATCTVSWPERSGEKSVEMTQILTNWKK